MFAIILAILGGLTTLVSFGKDIIIPLLNSYDLKKQDFNLFDEWASSFEPKDITVDDWLLEKVLIERNWRGQVTITNKDNKEGYSYKCITKIEKRNGVKYLVGNWKSSINNVDKHGKILLMLLSNGVLIGNYTGHNRQGTLINGGWVLGRTLYDLEMGKLLYLKGCINQRDRKYLNGLKGKPIPSDQLL